MGVERALGAWQLLAGADLVAAVFERATRRQSCRRTCRRRRSVVGWGGYQHPWILRNRNLYAHNTKQGTGKFFYMVTIQGFPCDFTRDAQALLGLIKNFAQGFHGIIDIWQAKPACQG